MSAVRDLLDELVAEWTSSVSPVIRSHPPPLPPPETEKDHAAQPPPPKRMRLAKELAEKGLTMPFVRHEDDGHSSPLSPSEFGGTPRLTNRTPSLPVGDGRNPPPPVELVDKEVMTDWPVPTRRPPPPPSVASGVPKPKPSVDLSDKKVVTGCPVFTVRQQVTSSSRKKTPLAVRNFLVGEMQKLVNAGRCNPTTAAKLVAEQYPWLLKAETLRQTYRERDPIQKGFERNPQGIRLSSELCLRKRPKRTRANPQD